MRSSVRAATSLLSAAVLVGLAACGSAGSAPAQDSAGPLEVWSRSASDAAAVYTQVFAAFTAKTGIQVDYHPIIEFDQQLQSRVASKDLPDMWITYMETLGTYKSQGLIVSVDPKDIAGSDQLTKETWDSARGLDGKYYGVPFSRQTMVTYVRKDWREKLGLPIPKTWDEFTAMAEAFATRDPDGDGKADTYGMNIPGSAQDGYLARWAASYLYQAGGDVVADAGNGKYRAVADSPQMVTAVNWFKRLFCTPNVVIPSALTATTTNVAFFREGHAGIWQDAPRYLPQFDQYLGKDVYEIIPPPAGPAGQTVLAEGDNAYIAAGSDKVQAQRKLAEFLITPEAQEIGMRGAKAPIVRIPVNRALNPVTVTGDSRWTIPHENYTKFAKPFQAALDFVPIKQALAESLNAMLADCNSNVAVGLAALQKSVSAELADQGVLQS